MAMPRITVARTGLSDMRRNEAMAMEFLRSFARYIA
jgi:hypothetical protein